MPTTNNWRKGADIDFAKWIEENCEVIREDKITLYRYSDPRHDGVGNYTLNDIYAVYNEFDSDEAHVLGWDDDKDDWVGGRTGDAHDMMGIQPPLPASLDQRAKELHPYSEFKGGASFDNLKFNQHQDTARAAYIHGLKECMPLIEALKEIEEIVLRYDKENGNSPAANHCRNIAMQALAAFPTPDKPMEDRP